jgi:diguanylate cyclase (GGDEF)-like protein/PAS domain S-box-containing protein
MEPTNVPAWVEGAVIAENPDSQEPLKFLQFPADNMLVRFPPSHMADLLDPEILGTVLDSLNTGIYVIDRNGKILFWSTGAERITGYRRHEVVGRPVRQTILTNCNQQGCADCGAQCPFHQPLLNGKAREARIRFRHKNGHPLGMLLRVVPLRDRRGSIVGAAASFDEQRFSTDRDRAQYNLAAYGCMDEVTNTPNRDFTRFHLRENLAGFTEYHLPFGVMYIRINGLEQFHASYGRQAGDAILRVVAQTMRNSLRPADFLGRWSEDCFLVILVNCPASGVERAVERTRKVVHCAHLQWWGDQLSVTTSVGYATTQPGDTMNSIVDRALHSLNEVSAQQGTAAESSQKSAPLSHS